jgi:hypothetical protein
MAKSASRPWGAGAVPVAVGRRLYFRCNSGGLRLGREGSSAGGTGVSMLAVGVNEFAERALF